MKFFYFSCEQIAHIKCYFPRFLGVLMADDKHISVELSMSSNTVCNRKDGPSEYGPCNTLCKRFIR